MGRLVRERYPTEKLPVDLRDGLSRDGLVRVIIEELAEPISNEGDAGSEALDLEGLLALRRRNFSSVEEVDADVRAMRDEWD